MQRAYKVCLSQEQDDDLRRFARSRTLPARLVERSKMVLACALGHNVEEIAKQLDVARQTVSRWLGRYSERGLDGLEKDLPRSGRPPTILPPQIAGIVAKTTRETPVGATHWSTRTLAPEVGVSASTIGRIWRAHGLKPHRVSSFKLSNDPRFAEKLEDCVDLYLHPPANAMVWSLDEKCQIQALQRTQPGLPWKNSWLNQVERFFRDLTEKCLRRGVFHSVAEVQQAIRSYVDEHNRNPKPYLWTANAKDILEKVKRAWQTLTTRGYAPKKLAALESIERHLVATAMAAP